MSRPREWRQRGRAKAEVVVVGELCTRCQWPEDCRVNGAWCDEIYSPTEVLETTDAPE